MKKIINLTQHVATPEQVAAGVVELTGRDVTAKLGALNFSARPCMGRINQSADVLAALACGYGAAMIGGAPYLMGPLEQALREVGIVPLYAFSVRESTETTDPVTGAVTKVAVFRHCGFVEGAT